MTADMYGPELGGGLRLIFAEAGVNCFIAEWTPELWPSGLMMLLYDRV